MQLINDFVRRYRKEFDFYDQAARLALQIIEQNVRRAGIRAIVTSRAKSPIRLEEKVRPIPRNFHRVQTPLTRNGFQVIGLLIIEFDFQTLYSTNLKNTITML